MSRRCSYCDGPVPTDEWHPVVTMYEVDEVQIHYFCTDSCRSAWERDRET